MRTRPCGCDSDVAVLGSPQLTPLIVSYPIGRKAQRDEKTSLLLLDAFAIVDSQFRNKCWKFSVRERNAECKSQKARNLKILREKWSHMVSSAHREILHPKNPISCKNVTLKGVR